MTVIDDPTPTYIEASDYYASSAGQTSWQNAKAALVAGFNNICGDTFCSSDYGDLQSLAFVCSITKSTGNIKGCEWVFGGSFWGVAKTGALTETSNGYHCSVAVKGTLSQLITTLNAAGTTDAIQRPLPGLATSAYDALGDCLP